MGSGDNAVSIKRQTEYDLLVVGGGIIGCWTAYKAGKGGLKTLLIERDKIGAGASGGLLGALMPHMPERWDGKKQFQFEALHDLKTEIYDLEQETGISCGYLQCGRLAPLMNETKRGQMQGHSADVDTYWLGHYHWNIIDQSPVPDWPIPSKASHGFVLDTLSARINPRGVLKALKAAMLKDENISLCEGLGLVSFDGALNTATLTDQTDVGFSHIVLANGPQSFGFIAPQLSVKTAALGKPVKGQAAMMAADTDANWPIMFDAGLYVISHGSGQVAIGSTSEVEFDAPLSTDQKLEDLIARAREYCPILKDAIVTERWAGLRPRAIGRDPLIDCLPDNPNVIISTSGFKITFGVAHKMADVALEYIFKESTIKVPDSFRIPPHLAKAKRAETQDEFLLKN
jgi:glycine oxidase